MFIVDNLVTAPFKGLFWVFNEIHQAAQQEQAGEAEQITAQLSELYLMLDTGRISEAEFDAREKQLLDRLDRIKETGARLESEKKPRAKKKKPRLRKKLHPGAGRGRGKPGETVPPA